MKSQLCISIQLVSYKSRLEGLRRKLKGLSSLISGDDVITGNVPNQKKNSNNFWVFGPSLRSEVSEPNCTHPSEPVTTVVLFRIDKKLIILLFIYNC